MNMMDKLEIVREIPCDEDEKLIIIGNYIIGYNLRRFMTIKPIDCINSEARSLMIQNFGLLI